MNPIHATARHSPGQDIRAYPSHCPTVGVEAHLPPAGKVADLQGRGPVRDGDPTDLLLIRNIWTVGRGDPPPHAKAVEEICKNAPLLYRCHSRNLPGRSHRTNAGTSNRERESLMSHLKLVSSYSRYVFSSLAAIAFGTQAQ
jgi:hypothetical protein